MSSSDNNGCRCRGTDDDGDDGDDGKEQMRPSLLLNIPVVVSTGRILPFVESSDLLSFRIGSAGCYRLVHGGRRTVSSSTRSSTTSSGGGAAAGSATSTSGDSARDATPSHDVRDGGDDEKKQKEDDDEDVRREAENLWRQMLAQDFGFCHNWDVRCGDPDGTLKGNMHLRTFRDPDEADYIDSGGGGLGNSSSYGAAFLRTDQEMTATHAFESWKRWERLRVRFDMEARSATVPIGGNGDDHIAPKAEESFSIIGPFFLRCAETWRTIEKWCKNSRASGSVGQRILTSLQPGQALPLSKTTLGYEPRNLESQPVGIESLMALYAFYAGQEKGLRGPPRSNIEVDSAFAGLMGSVSAYQYFASTRLCVPFCADGRESTVAESTALVDIAPSKVFTLELGAGTILSSPMRGQDDIGTYAITSIAAPSSTITPGRMSDRDSIIVWMKEYATRLENGMYAVGNISPYAGATTKAILLYPTLNGSATTYVNDATGGTHTASMPSGRVSRCVTRGVEVVASAVHAYEIHKAIYSIRIRIVQSGEEGYLSPSGRGFHSCQLRSRRWTLTSKETGEEEHVSGGGVTGFYPLLLPDGGHHVYYGRDAAHASLINECEEETFAYQSMSNVYEEGGTMKGELQFVPGSISQPTGPEFDVVVSSFPLPTFDDGDHYIY